MSDNSPQTTLPRSSDSVVDKRTKNNLYDIKSWVHTFSLSIGLEVDQRTRGLVVWRSGASCLGRIIQGAICRYSAYFTHVMLVVKCEPGCRRYLVHTKKLRGLGEIKRQAPVLKLNVHVCSLSNRNQDFLGSVFNIIQSVASSKSRWT